MANNGNTIIADRYSEALIQLAKDGQMSFVSISKDLNTIKEMISQSRDLYEFLITPLVSVEDKKEVIGKVFVDEIDTLILNFLKVLIDKNRFNAFDEIVSSFNKSLDDIDNISRVLVTSAVSMTEDAKNRLVEKLSSKMKKNVVIENDIDENILAGLVIKIGDNIIDTSLRHKLDSMKKNITK